MRTNSYAMRAYGVTREQLKRFEKKVHGKIAQERKTGKLRTYTGSVEALIGGTDK